MGAVAQPEVPRRERAWNERSTVDDGENAGGYRLLCVNVLKTQHRASVAGVPAVEDTRCDSRLNSSG
jgi:hypothetical protein